MFDKGPVLPVQRRLCFQFLRGQTQVTLKHAEISHFEVSVAPETPQVKLC